MQPGPLVPDPPTPSLGCEPRAIPVHVHVLVSHRHETLTFSHCRPRRWDCGEVGAASCLRRSCVREQRATQRSGQLAVNLDRMR